jgi:hypothetical protein
MRARRLFQLFVCGAYVISMAAAEPENSRPAALVQTGPRLSSSLTEAELLRRVQVSNEDLYASLQSFVCQETIERTRENLEATKVRRLDTLTARVSFENGEEQYTAVRQNNSRRAGLSTAGGAWSEGEFGTLLRQTQQLLKTQGVTVQAVKDQEALLRFDVSAEDSPWTLIVGGRSYKLPFRTEVLVETASGHILAVKRSAGQIPSELYITGIEWAVQLTPTNWNGGTWLLPASAEYSVYYANSNRREHNRMSFSGYRRYGSQAALRFDAID